ncbi:hypothetical protein [Levilactobacillus sp. N40-8-2]|uniref:hypothetical protein n=1 Tax=Levilactobacillus muriae TaxID=3238987 RepID=UPI0038B29F24
MNYESLLLETMEKVNRLGNEVEKLKKTISEIFPDKEKISSEKASTMTKFNKAEVIEKIQRLNAKSNLTFDKASLRDGGGLMLNETHKIMLRRSRNYAHDSVKSEGNLEWSSWFMVEKEAFSKNSFEGYIFFVETDTEPAVFVLNHKEMKEMLNKKILEDGKYHFYFQKTKNGEILETRTDDLNAEKYLGNWQALEKI